MRPAAIVVQRRSHRLRRTRCRFREHATAASNATTTNEPRRERFTRVLYPLCRGTFARITLGPWAEEKQARLAIPSPCGTSGSARSINTRRRTIGERRHFGRGAGSRRNLGQARRRLARRDAGRAAAWSWSRRWTASCVGLGQLVFKFAEGYERPEAANGARHRDGRQHCACRPTRRRRWRRR